MHFVCHHLITDVTHKNILSTKDTKSTKKRLNFGILAEMEANKVCIIASFFVSFVLFVDYCFFMRNISE